MKPQDQVTVRSTETDDVYRINRAAAERHQAAGLVTVLADEEAAEVEATSRYEDQNYNDLRSEIGTRNADRDEDDRIPAAGKKAELIAALVADDNR